MHWLILVDFEDGHFVPALELAYRKTPASESFAQNFDTILRHGSRAARKEIDSRIPVLGPRMDGHVRFRDGDNARHPLRRELVEIVMKNRGLTHRGRV